MPRKHDSDWTAIYWGSDPARPGRLYPTVRIVLGYCDGEEYGFSHGLPTNVFFDDEDAAIRWARRVDAYIEEAMRGFMEEAADRMFRKEKDSD